MVYLKCLLENRNSLMGCNKLLHFHPVFLVLNGGKDFWYFTMLSYQPTIKRFMQVYLHRNRFMVGFLYALKGTELFCALILKCFNIMADSSSEEKRNSVKEGKYGIS